MMMNGYLFRGTMSFLHPFSIGINSFMLFCGQILSYKSRLYLRRAPGKVTGSLFRFSP